MQSAHFHEVPWETLAGVAVVVLIVQVAIIVTSWRSNLDLIQRLSTPTGKHVAVRRLPLKGDRRSVIAVSRCSLTMPSWP